MVTTFAARPYQVEAKDAIQAAWEQGQKKALLVLPTGTGKTIVFCKLIEDQVRKGDRVLVLAHRGELLDQAADKLSKSTGLGCAVEKADQTCLGEFYRVVVGSVQTLCRPKRLAKFRPDYFDVIIVDEAHRVLAPTYQRILDHFAGAKVLGVTATPDRGDLKNLGEFFDTCAYEYSLPKAIKEGYLVPIKAMTIPLKIDLSNVAQRSGDFAAGDVGSALDPYLEQIAEEMTAHCAGRKTVVFLPLIATSQKFCDILKRKGFRAAEINGESKDRAQLLAAFDRGDFDVLCNSMLLVEGWDCPSVDCIIPLRPTKIRSLFCQMVGRGTRLFPGKSDLLLIDFLWATSRLDLCRPAGLIAESQDVADKMTEQINESGCPVDITEAEERAEGDCILDREDALAKRLAELKHKKGSLVDPLKYEMSIDAEDLAGYVPDFGYNPAPPTDRQMELLEKAGIFPLGVESADKAALILDKVAQRRAAGLTSAKQIQCLERKGFQNVGAWEFDSAKRMIDRIAGNSWRVPPGIDPATYQPQQKQEAIFS